MPIIGPGGGGGGGAQTVFVQADDPGAIGPGLIWVDTTTDPPTVNVRNSDDDGWAVSFNGGSITNALEIHPDADTGFALHVRQAFGGTFEIVNVQDEDAGYLLLIDKASIGIAGTEALPAQIVMTVAEGVQIAGDTINNTYGLQIKPSGGFGTPLIGFFGHTPAARPTGVPVTAADIHAALVSLGLITA